MRFLPLIFAAQMLVSGTPEGSQYLKGVPGITLNARLTGWKRVNSLGPFAELKDGGKDFAISGITMRPIRVETRNGLVARITCLVRDEEVSDQAYETLKAFFNAEFGPKPSQPETVSRGIWGQDKLISWGLTPSIDLFSTTDNLAVAGAKPPRQEKKKVIRVIWSYPNSQALAQEMRVAASKSMRK